VHSFLDSRSDVDPLAPVPDYFTDKQLSEPLETNHKEILKVFEKKEDGALLCTDQTVLDKQSGVLYDVAKQLFTVLLQGKSISHISVPVKIFEPRSSIQRIVD